MQYKILRVIKSSVKLILSENQLQIENLQKWKTNGLSVGTRNISFIHHHQYQQLLHAKEHGDIC